MALGVLVAALGGAAIGIERQRSGKASGVNARFGGIRTFTLLGGIAGLAGALAREGLVGLAMVVAGAAGAVVIAGYVAASRRDVDATTEVAALVVIAAGVTAGLGHFLVANGAIALTALLLIEKPRLHAFAARIDDEEMRAAGRFGVMALVITPLLPEGPIAALAGVRPRELWLLVLLFSGMSFAGYLVRRAIGAGIGYPIAGLLGGLVSSTAVTLTFSRLSRSEPGLGRPLAVGAIAACTVLVPRVLAATLVLDRRVAASLAPYLAAPLVIGAVAFALGVWRARGPGHREAETPLTNPLQLKVALQMVVMFQLVLFVVQYVGGVFGSAGLLATGAVLGLTDVDALTVSMTRGAADGIDAAVAAQAIAVGIMANTAVKAGLALVLGSAAVKRIAGGVLLLMCAAIAAALSVR
jgi:uncharacterized membrane protein (DUF4010 family)